MTSPRLARSSRSVSSTNCRTRSGVQGWARAGAVAGCPAEAVSFRQAPASAQAVRSARAVEVVFTRSLRLAQHHPVHQFFFQLRSRDAHLSRALVHAAKLLHVGVNATLGCLIAPARVDHEEPLLAVLVLGIAV